jgi:predicted nucleic acid-binding protein
VSGYVLDASVAVTALTEPGSGAADLLADTDAVFQAPSIFDVEVISALRGLVRGGKYDRTAANGGTPRPSCHASGNCAKTSLPTTPPT